MYLTSMHVCINILYIFFLVYIRYIYIYMHEKYIHIYIAVSQKNALGLLDLFNAMQLSAEDRSCKAQHHDADLMGVSRG